MITILPFIVLIFCGFYYYYRLYQSYVCVSSQLKTKYELMRLKVFAKKDGGACYEGYVEC